MASIDKQNLICFKNGVYDLIKHQFVERDAYEIVEGELSTGLDYVKYDPTSVDAVEINTYLSQVFTSAIMCEHIKDMMASIIDGTTQRYAHSALIFTGTGSNSRTTFLNLFKKALGDYACNVLPGSDDSDIQSAAKGRKLVVMNGYSRALTGSTTFDCCGRTVTKESTPLIMDCSHEELHYIIYDNPNINNNRLPAQIVYFASLFVENPNPERAIEFKIDTTICNKLDRWAETLISMLITHHKTLKKN